MPPGSRWGQEEEVLVDAGAGVVVLAGSAFDDAGADAEEPEPARESVR